MHDFYQIFRVSVLFISENSLFLRACVSSQKNWVESTENFRFPANSPTLTTSATANIGTRRTHPLQSTDSQWHMIITQSPWPTLGFTLDVYSLSFDKHLMTCTSSIMYNSSTAPNVLCISPIIPPVLYTLQIIGLFTDSLFCLFPELHCMGEPCHGLFFFFFT